MRRLSGLRRILAALSIASAACVPFGTSISARADVAFLLEEPYGEFGAMNPTGHGALYFNHICAASPTELRPCRDGEPGVVISRYHSVGGYDWLAVPLVPYLYSVERAEDIPGSADRALRDQLRDAYRRAHLAVIAPDEVTKGGDLTTPDGNWTQLVGASYDRRIYGFQIETTHQDDERFIAEFNDKSNVDHFNLFFHNCADFSRVVLNSYFPHAVKRSFLADFGLTTPKQVARSLTKYAKKNPDVPFSVFVIPQIQGSIARSHKVNGVAESMIKSKKYVVPMALLYPEFTAMIGATYITRGRFSPPKDAEIVLLPREDARATLDRRLDAKAGLASVNTHAGVDIEDKQRSLDEHGVDLERGEGEGIAGSLGRAAQ